MTSADRKAAGLRGGQADRDETPRPDPGAGHEESGARREAEGGEGREARGWGVKDEHLNGKNPAPSLHLLMC